MAAYREAGRSAWPLMIVPGLAVLLVLLSTVGSAGAAAPVAKVFSFTGSEQVYSVPAGVTSVEVKAVGAPGGPGDGTNRSRGGFGAELDASIPVAPGELIYVEVGGPGGTYPATGAFNGGGPGVAGMSPGFGSGGGGGASDVRTCSITASMCAAGSSLQSRMIVAAGGGGGGGAEGLTPGANGGDQSSAGGNVMSGPSGGGPGGSTTCSMNAFAGAGSGTFGMGGFGGSPFPPGSSSDYGAGGGGGGGWCGGGGGQAQNAEPGAGGGGGSVFLAGPAVDLPASTDHTGIPKVTITSIDSTAPSIAVQMPTDGAVFPQGALIPASYSCSDEQGGSGLASCAGPVAPGQPVDTSTPGAHTFAVNASDRAGNTSARTVSYQVAALAASGGAVVSGATESSSRWRAGNALPHESRRRRVPVGTTFKFTLNKTAVVRFDFTQSVPGRKAAGKCVSQNKRNKRKRKCTRSVVRGTFSFTGHAGVNSVRFEGRVSRSKKLKSGKYTLVISAGSNSQKLTFTIVK